MNFRTFLQNLGEQRTVHELGSPQNQKSLGNSTLQHGQASLRQCEGQG